MIHTQKEKKKKNRKKWKEINEWKIHSLIVLNSLIQTQENDWEWLSPHCVTWPWDSQHQFHHRRLHDLHDLHDRGGDSRCRFHQLCARNSWHFASGVSPVSPPQPVHFCAEFVWNLEQNGPIIKRLFHWSKLEHTKNAKTVWKFQISCGNVHKTCFCKQIINTCISSKRMNSAPVFFLSLYWAFSPLWQSPKSGWCAHAPGDTTRWNNPCTKRNMYLASPCSSGDFIGIPQPPQQPSRGNPRYGGLRRARAEPNRSGMETVSWTPAECNVKSCCTLFFYFLHKGCIESNDCEVCGF